MYCGALGQSDEQRALETLARRSAESGVFPIRNDPVYRSLTVNRKCEVLVEMVSLIFIGRTNGLLRVNNDLIRLCRTDFNITEIIHDLNLGIGRHVLPFDMLIVCVVVARNIPEIDITDGENIPDVRTEIRGSCYGASCKDYENQKH